jgi:soluble P-type ATPase
MAVHVLTADTRGTCRDKLSGLPVRVNVLDSRPEDEAKQAYVQSIGPARCAAIGNGRNDRLMLRTAGLGIAVLGPEGASPGALTSADVVVHDALSALELFTHPQRLLATLRT